MLKARRIRTTTLLAAIALTFALGCDKGNPNEPFPGARTLTMCSAGATGICLLTWPSATATGSLPPQDTIYELGVRFSVFVKSSADTPVGHVDPGTSHEVTFGTKTSGGSSAAVYIDSAGGRAYEMRTSLTPGEHNLGVSLPGSMWGLRVNVSVASEPYSAVLLPLGTSPDADALDLNSAGDAVGWTLDSNGARRPAVWRAGTLAALSYPSIDSGTATSINDNGLIAGIVKLTGETACTWGNHRPVLWRPNAAPIQLGSTCTYILPRINNLGHVAVTGDSVRLFASDGSVLPLAYPCGSSCGGYGIWRANDLNDRDQVVGVATDELSEVDVAMAWGLKLGVLGAWHWISPHGLWSFFAVNDSAQTLGKSIDTYFLSTPGASPIDLIVTGGVPVALNNRGTVVAFDGANSAIYLWQHRRTRRVRLPTGWRIDRVAAINDAGQIVGHGTSPSGTRGPVLLTPATP